MKVQENITIIISKNYGRSISVNLPAWQFFLGLFALSSALMLMLVLSVLFLVSYPQSQQMKYQYENLLREQGISREKKVGANNEFMEAKTEKFLAMLNDSNGKRGSDGDFSGQDELFQPPIVLESLKTTVNGKSVEVVFRLKNPKKAENRGGYLYAIFENEDKEPHEYQVSPPVALNEEGFPQSYKLGIRFARINDAVSFRRRVKRAGKEDYFTHVTLFLFSVRGGLLLKERLEMERDLFFQEGPAVHSQKFDQI